MTTLAIRKKLSEYLQTADEKKVKAVYALLEEDINNVKSISTEQYNNELAEAETEYKNGDFISHNEMLKQIKKW